MYFTRYPYLQTPSESGMTVLWETDAPGTTELMVWKARCPACGICTYSPDGAPTSFPGEAGTLHLAQANGLAPETDYCYQVTTRANGNVLTGEMGVFRTAPGEDSPLSFAVTAESGGSSSPRTVLDSVARAIERERPDFLLFVGDMVKNGGRLRDWDDFLFSPFRTLIAHTPFYHCAGNHEEHSVHMRDLLATPPEGYYAFRYGCAQFVALDTTQFSDHIENKADNYRIELTQPLDETNPQVRFLISALEASDAPWKFVFLHYPPYFDGTWEAPVLRPLCAIFERYGVDVAFTSHAIVYERSHPIRGGKIDEACGVRYLVVGGAGVRENWFHHKKAWHTAKSRAIPHFVHAAVTPGRMELQAIDNEGRLFDLLCVEKRPADNGSI